MSGSTLTLSNWATIGENCSAQGGALAIGWAFASGSSLAIGDDIAAETDSLVVGISSTAINQSAALGEGLTVSGNAFATGYYNTAFGSSFVAGEFSVATGVCSASLGESNTSLGNYSLSLGFYTTARSHASVVIGRFNKASNALGTTDNWVETEPLFVIGNGTGAANDPNQYRDALVVYKNGNIRMQKAQGDISMGAFAQ